jgi:hypothetical protein
MSVIDGLFEFLIREDHSCNGLLMLMLNGLQDIDSDSERMMTLFEFIA